MTRPIDRGSAEGRAVVDRQTVHIHDMAAERRRITEAARPTKNDWASGQHLPSRYCERESAIGAIVIRRQKSVRSQINRLSC